MDKILQHPLDVFLDSFPMRSRAIVDLFFKEHAVHFLSGIGVNSDIAENISDALLASMSNPALKYHTPLHILTIFAFAKKNKIKLKTEEELAIWFHDAIYNVGDKNSEASSAMFMSSLLSGRINEKKYPFVLSGADNLVRATAHYSYPDVLDSEKLILDLDLSTMAWPREQFVKAQELIAKEFIPVYGDKYFVGRKEFLNGLLDRKSIYRTKQFAKFEKQARENIEYAIKKGI